MDNIESLVACHECGRMFTADSCFYLFGRYICCECFDKTCDAGSMFPDDYDA